jgi:hypothetical protein
MEQEGRVLVLKFLKVKWLMSLLIVEIVITRYLFCLWDFELKCSLWGSDLVCAPKGIVHCYGTLGPIDSSLTIRTNPRERFTNFVNSIYIHNYQPQMLCLKYSGDV